MNKQLRTTGPGEQLPPSSIENTRLRAISIYFQGRWTNPAFM